MRKPTFVLKPQAYKTNKLYAQVPHDGTGDLTPSSYAGNGTRVNKYGLIEAVASDVPRIDYLDGIGLLLEPTRQNQATESEDFSLWTVSNATFTANNTVAPDGEYTATLLQDGTGTAKGFASESYVPTDPTAVHTVSIFVKFGSSRAMTFRVLDDTSGGYYRVDPDGTMTELISDGGKGISWGTEYYGNGWWRVHVVFDMVNTDTNLVTQVYAANYISNTDDEATGSIWIWGHQIEQGYFPTSYIPTSGSALTRAYDVLQLSGISGLNILSVGSGAILADVDIVAAAPDASGNMITMGNTGGAVNIISNASSPNYPIVRVVNPSTTAPYTLTTTRARVLWNIFGSGTEIWVNGTRQVNDTVDMYLAATDLQITGVNTKFKLREMAIWDSPLNATESKAITQS